MVAGEDVKPRGSAFKQREVTCLPKYNLEDEVRFDRTRKMGDAVINSITKRHARDDDNALKLMVFLQQETE